MAAESLTRSSAINLINGSIDSFMFSHACYCTSNMESLSEDDIELYDQMHEVISILNDDEDYRHDLETMPLEDLKEFLLMCRKMADNNNLSLKSEFPQGNFEIVEDEPEKTETELNPDKIDNEKSFWNTLWGALQGEYNENPTGTEILIDMGLNFIPFVGQACDVRDITACLKKLVIEKRVNEIMIWVTLLLTAIGCVPYAGDVVKAGCKAIIKGADDIVLKILRKLDADDVQKAFKILRSKFTSSIDDATAMVNKWIEKAGNSKYGSKINEVLTGANENLRKASDFVTGKIDEFEEWVFGKKADVADEMKALDDVPKRKVEELEKLNDSATKALEELPEHAYYQDLGKQKHMRGRNGIIQNQGSLSGSWIKVNETMSDFSREYQKQITGKVNEVWMQNGVKFDGMDAGVLLDAKGKYSQFINEHTGEFYDWFKGKDSLLLEAQRQIAASDGAPIKWFFAEEDTLSVVKDLFIDNNITQIELIFEPLK